MFTPPNMSRVTRHVSHVTCHVSHVIIFSSSFSGQSGEAYRWRVCYQRGLPRLVLISVDKLNFYGFWPVGPQFSAGLSLQTSLIRPNVPYPSKRPLCCQTSYLLNSFLLSLSVHSKMSLIHSIVTHILKQVRGFIFLLKWRGLFLY